jgi:hypothetical protein
MKSPLQKLTRFTTLPVLMDLLQRKKIVLLSPRAWEDRNDAEILLDYQARKGLGRVLALCFSQGDETIHHWKAFSDGISGCCIEFDAPKLLALFDAHKLRHGPVIYKKMNDVGDGSISFDHIPFIKRHPYRCEEEYRVILEDAETTPCYEIDVDLSLIRRITISQRMPEPVYRTIKNCLRNVTANPAAKIFRSTLFENQAWLNKFKRFQP